MFELSSLGRLILRVVAISGAAVSRAGDRPTAVLIPADDGVD